MAREFLGPFVGRRWKIFRARPAEVVNHVGARGDDRDLVAGNAWARPPDRDRLDRLARVDELGQHPRLLLVDIRREVSARSVVHGDRVWVSFAVGLANQLHYGTRSEVTGTARSLVVPLAFQLREVDAGTGQAYV